MMWNAANSETTLTAAAVTELRRRLPASWAVEGQRIAVAQPVRTSNMVVTISAAEGPRATLAIAAKEHLDAVNVGRVLDAVTATARGQPMICTPYLGPSTRARILELGGNYFDLTGNLHLHLASPAVFLSAQGSDRDPNPQPRALASLKGPAAGRAIRGLAELRPPFGVRDLATRIGSSPASVSRVVQLLQREGVLERGSQGEVVAVRWLALLRRWAADYDTTASNAVSTWLAPRGVASVLQGLRRLDRYAITGSFAASRLAPVAAPRLLAVYVEDVGAAAATLDVRPAEAGTNVLLVEPFDAVVFERTMARDGHVLANPGQVVVDLLTSAGRGPAEAEALLKWMGEHEGDWRIG